MADISTYLAQILSAVYGEDVRGSIHDAIEIINEVSEVVLTTGTAVTGPTSSSTGFFTDSLYLNTSTYELWKCAGTDTWASQGILKGATGADGADGNRWYRGVAISGKSPNPTVFAGSGITDANANDFYLNPSEGAVYHCVTGGDAATATWSYDFTMTGGGGSGDIVTWTQVVQSGTKIAEIDINGSSTDVYAPNGGGGTTDAEILIRDTVGWTGKNLLENKAESAVKSDITYTVNADGTVNANGTASANAFLELNNFTLEAGDYILSQGAVVSTFGALQILDTNYNELYKVESGTSKSFTLSSDTAIIVRIRIAKDKQVSNVKIYPMLRKADISDATYEPYHETVEQCKFDRAEQNVLGAKNLLPYPTGTRQVIDSSGVISNDANMYLSDFIDVENAQRITMSITAFTGEVSARFAFYTSAKVFISRPREVFVSGTLSFTKDVPANAKYIRMCFEDGSTNGVTNPMLRLASDPDDTYVPYAMTNREITEAIANIPTVNDGQLTIQQNGTTKGTFTANSSTAVTANIITDEWTADVQTLDGTTFVFSGLDDSYGYDLYVTDKLVGVTAVNKTGSGTATTLTYTVTGAAIGDYAALRIIK